MRFSSLERKSIRCLNEGCLLYFNAHRNSRRWHPLQTLTANAAVRYSNEDKLMRLSTSCKLQRPHWLTARGPLETGVQQPVRYARHRQCRTSIPLLSIATSLSRYKVQSGPWVRSTPKPWIISRRALSNAAWRRYSKFYQGFSCFRGLFLAISGIVLSSFCFLPRCVVFRHLLLAHAGSRIFSGIISES